MQAIKERNSFPEPGCRQDTEYAETNQVSLDSITGLWVLLAACFALAAVMAVLEYFWWLRGSPEKRAIMRARMLTLFACGRRGDPDAWARTETLRARAKQDLPPTTYTAGSGIIGGMTALLRRTGRPRTTDDFGMSRAFRRRAASPPQQPKPGRALMRQRNNGIAVSPRGLEAIIQCANEERAAEEGDNRPASPHLPGANPECCCMKTEGALNSMQDTCIQACMRQVSTRLVPW